jgi:hypothetical protein
MSYITRAHVSKALKGMLQFYDQLRDLHENFGLQLEENRGRRNILMSSAQEEFFARALSQDFKGVDNSGKTGEPDIVIKQLQKELECKITSPHQSGAISFQTDWATLCNKGSLDYLYIVADEQFEKFVVLHYTDLTKEDFAPPASGSRGKSRMIKHKAAAKCNVLWGKMLSKNEMELDKLRKRLAVCSSNAQKKKAKIEKSIKYWQTTPTKYTFEYGAVN